MIEVRRINVDNQRQIIDARLHVRTMARDMGFNTMDQARVALATSTLAQLVGLDGRYEGTIDIGKTSDEPASLQVVCEVYCGEAGAELRQNKLAFDQLRSMVDELQIRTLLEGLQITMIKNKVSGRMR